MENRTDPPFQVRRADLIEREPWHSTPGTRQGDTMLTVCMAGRGRYVWGEREIAVGRAMVGLVPPDTPGVLAALPQDPYTHYYCRFNGWYAQLQARRIIAQQGARFFPVANVEEIADCIRRMGPRYTPELPTEMGMAEVLLARALVLLQRQSTDSTPPRLSVATLQEYLRSRIAEKPDLTRMADYFGVSRTTLCRTAQHLLGMTVVCFSTKQKIDWAQTLLRQPRLNVTEVAHMVGYRDALYFSKVFKRAVGISPKRWARPKPVEA